MKNAFLLIVVSALLVTLGLAQAPGAGSNTNVANVSGCLAGSDGAYTVTEDGTRQVFKITTSTVDLKAHVGHDVKLTGQNTSVAAGSGAADHSFAVTELSMISEHCAAAAAATAGAAAPYAETVVEPAAPPATPPAAPSATASAPAPDAAAPAATASAPTDVNAPAAAVTTPAAEPATPAAVVSPASSTVSTPPMESAAPALTENPSPAAVKTPVAKAVHPAPAARARKGSAAEAAASAAIAPTEPATTTPTSEPAASAAADAATAAAAVKASPEAVPVPDASSPDAAAAPAPPATHRAGSLSLLVGFVVLVIVLGTTAPLIGRWRKRKMLERDGSPNLSFTNDAPRSDASTNEVTAREARSGQDTTEPRKVA